MNNSEKWDEFLSKATAAEVFSKIGKSITLNDQIPIKKRQLMTEQIWNRYEYLKKHKQKSIFEQASDPEWWAS